MGPDPAVAEVRRAVRQALEALPRTPGPVLVACSGGPDSVALAAATVFEARRAGREAGLITVDHGLQPDSQRQAAAVASLGFELGFDPVEAMAVDVGTAGGPEAAARTARYGALDAAADAFDSFVLLGHTLDDQAETVLLGLGRGSGPRSIAGMPPVSGRYVRPLLGVRRATTRAACRALGLPWWDDPHNSDPSFRRTRLRLEALPLLEEVLGGGVVEALARTAALVRSDLAALDEMTGALTASSAGEDPGAGLDVAHVAELPVAVRARVLRDWARAAGAGPLTAVHTAALEGLVTAWRGQGPIDLPGGRRVRRASGRLELIPPDQPVTGVPE